MNETGTGAKPPSRLGQSVDRLRNGATIVAAVAGAVTGMWGIYEKVRKDAQAYTAASYDTLAPQMNQMSEALRQLQQDNQRLRELVASDAAPAGVVSAVVEPPARSGRRAPDRRTPRTPAASPPAVNPAVHTPEPAGPQGSQGGHPMEKLRRSVEETRKTIEEIRRVPESFQNVLDRKK